MGDLPEYAPQITSMRDDHRGAMPGGRVEMSSSEIASLGGNTTQVSRRATVRVQRGDSAAALRGLAAETREEVIAVAGGPGALATDAAVIPEPTPRGQAMVPQVLAQTVQQAVTLALPVQPPKVKVTITSRATGKMTLFCTGVAVSETIVVIQYPSDGQTAIYEPPAAADESDPLIVGTPEGPFRCISLGFSVELGGQYLVILVRLLDVTAALG